ncbi:MAG TPA: CDGSH iron-sulfur domain-containing protein [Candidatus Krumholzibacteria bacterium]|nr:CDGSH iron-sulfur domain-containing protein [Candidatus Krumholzibacteria bacterium]
MDKPRIADTRPAVLELAPGKYAYCTCGGSANQPFCDGSHGGSAFRPQIFEMAETKRVALCQCKHTAGAPFCDGTHKTIG